MDFGSGAGGERHGDEAERGDQGRHEHGTEPDAGGLTRRVGGSQPLGLTLDDVRHEHDAIENGNTEERDEAHAR